MVSREVSRIHGICSRNTAGLMVVLPSEVRSKILPVVLRQRLRVRTTYGGTLSLSTEILPRDDDVKECLRDAFPQQS